MASASVTRTRKGSDWFWRVLTRGLPSEGGTVAHVLDGGRSLTRWKPSGKTEDSFLTGGQSRKQRVTIKFKPRGGRYRTVARATIPRKIGSARKSLRRSPVTLSKQRAFTLPTRAFSLFGIGGYNGLGQSDQPQMTQVPVVNLQKLLLQKGISVGATGADGVWGPMTAQAYKNAVLSTDVPQQYSILTDPSASKTKVMVPKAALDAVRNLQNDPRPDPAEKKRQPVKTAAATMDALTLTGNGESKWPWVVGIGGGLLLLGGAYWYYNQPRRTA